MADWWCYPTTSRQLEGNRMIQLLGEFSLPFRLTFRQGAGTKGGEGVRTPLCGKCDVIFSYIIRILQNLYFIYPIFSGLDCF